MLIASHDLSRCTENRKNQAHRQCMQTLDLAFGTAMPKTVQDVFLWQLAGAGVATLVGPVAFTMKVDLPPPPPAASVTLLSADGGTQDRISMAVLPLEQS